MAKSNKHSRAGGKYTGNHTSLIPLAATLCDIAHKSLTVTKISPGFIKAGLRSVSGQRRVKITQDSSGILLAVRDNASHQEVRIYATDVAEAIQAISNGAKTSHIAVTLAKK